jgi:hypothetical protein
VIFVVGLVGFGSIYKVYREVKNSAPELAPKA